MPCESQPKQFFPLPGRFGVIRMDPVAMVEGLGDEAALNAARAMQPQKYLAYISRNIELPWPQRPWYGYFIYPITPGLRPEDPHKAITPDMCIPISPNTTHPTERTPLVTEPPFPFSNCYFWVDSETRVRIRGGVEFDNTCAVSLSAGARLEMQDNLDEDMNRAYDDSDIKKREELVRKAPQQLVPANDGGDSKCDDADTTSSLQDPCERSSSGSSSPPEGSRPPSVDSLDAIAALDPFGFHTDDSSRFPLVDLWFNITGHLTQEEVPSAVEFWKEQHEIEAIIKAARGRPAGPVPSPTSNVSLAAFDRIPAADSDVVAPARIDKLPSITRRASLNPLIRVVSEPTPSAHGRVAPGRGPRGLLRKRSFNLNLNLRRMFHNPFRSSRDRSRDISPGRT